jgi:hypothetical protein
MADVWDGGTATTGIVKWEFNTNKTAIRYTRTDGGPWPPDIPQAMTNNIIDGIKQAVEECERLASEIEKIDSAFAQVLRDQAAMYRGAAGTPPVTRTATKRA